MSHSPEKRAGKTRKKLVKAMEAVRARAGEPPAGEPELTIEVMAARAAEATLRPDVSDAELIALRQQRLEPLPPVSPRVRRLAE